MHNNIMAAGSKERPPMLGPGRYSQWHSRFLRYLDTKSNGEYLRKCIFDGPYMPTNVLIAAVEAAENILPVAAHEEAETIHNMTVENKLYFQAEKEAIFLILTGIGDEIYSTVDALKQKEAHLSQKLFQVPKEAEFALMDLMKTPEVLKAFSDDSTQSSTSQRWGGTLDKMKKSWDPCVMVGIFYSVEGISCLQQENTLNTDQASVFMEMMFVHISSGLFLHQMTSDHNRSELGIPDHNNEPVMFKRAVPTSCSLAVKNS
ncbi:hypothetical protein Tco_0020196 [Tanacetum coccineum]